MMNYPQKNFPEHFLAWQVLWNLLNLLQVIVKQTLQDFKRTHQDNWQEHKQKFTDDQLTVLTDLLVSPSYYA